MQVPAFGALAEPQEGIVEGFAPDTSGESWIIAVWLPSLEEVRNYSEDELTSRGLVEVERNDRGLERIVIDTPIDDHTFGSEVSVRLITDIEHKDEARKSTETAESAVHKLIPLGEVAFRVERDRESPNAFAIQLDLWPTIPSVDAFELLVEHKSDGWTQAFDDGWACEFWWSRDASPSGSAFLTPKARYVIVLLKPWTTPKRRPLRRHPEIDTD